ncbi:endonuclease G, mitochondrial-like [Paramacrobiotus metropolitanus]|uniref:endonuclease G, mitochondrial-like n=1 Tax=Paramacrobiotus metropolitanus TaxID=2943436 RepID=UPI002445783C|nr:endonuclease G, mitochondrial-like [Paramacrobiotus metropolitanus]
MPPTGTAKILAAGISAVAVGGLGGFVLGRSTSDPRRSASHTPFVVHADQKDGLQPAATQTALAPYNPQNKTVAPMPGGVAPDLSVGPHRVGEIMKHGFPTTDTVRSRSDYVLAYDRKNRTALWVAEHLTAERLKDRTKVSRSGCDFKDDPSIHPYFRSTNEDYFRSGFDRGHLAAAGNHWINQESMDETFYLSNISPQVGVGFNRDAWNKLEQYARFKTKSCSNVYVLTGPLYLPSMLEDGKTYVKYQVIGMSNVAVPTHFFKALLCQSPSGEYHLETYVMPNKAIDDKIPLQAFQVPPDTIERSAGFLLFEGLPRTAVKTVNGKKT